MAGVDEVRRLFGPDVELHLGGPSGERSDSATGQHDGTDQVKPVPTVPDTANIRFDLGVGHYQCSAARSVSQKVEITSIRMDETFGTVSLTDCDVIGSLNPPGDLAVGNTFHGARVKRGMEEVNQSVTITFDPCSFQCMTCKNSHGVFGMDGKPAVIVLSD